MNRIEWARKAVRQLLKLEKPIQRRIRDGVASLEAFPATANVRRLVDHQHAYRLRIANYRIFFEFDGNVRIVTIEEIRKRDERTY